MCYKRSSCVFNVLHLYITGVIFLFIQKKIFIVFCLFIFHLFLYLTSLCSLAIHPFFFLWQVNDNVTVILLSEIVWEKFRPNTGCFEPLLFHFPDYSKGKREQEANDR